MFFFFWFFFSPEKRGLHWTFQLLTHTYLGVIPIHLSELSPPAFRSSFVGITYQLGNMISSPSTQIVNTIAEGNEVHNAKGKLVPSYGPVMAVATAIIATGIIFTTMLGPEKRGRHFENEGPAGTNIEGLHASTKDIETGSIDEKTSGQEIEQVEQVQPKN